MELHDFVNHLTSLQATNQLEEATEFLMAHQDDFPIVHAAVMSGWTELLEGIDMLDSGDTVHETVENEQTVLHLAASASPEMLRTVLLKGIDHGLFEFDEEGYTPAMIAAMDGGLQNLKLLVRAGADLDQVDFQWGRTALGCACWQEDIQVLHYLLDAGADPTVVNLDGLEESTLGNEGISLIKEAAVLRQAMDTRRFKAIQVSMDAGEATLVMPTAIEEIGNLFVADVMNDLKSGAEEAYLEYGEKVFPGRNQAQKSELLGLSDVGKLLEERRQKQAEVEQTPVPQAPKGHKLH